MELNDNKMIEDIKSHMMQRYIIAFVILVILSIFAYLSMRAITLRQGRDLHIINIVSQQKISFQEASLLSMHLITASNENERVIIRDNLRQVEYKLKQTHDALIHGNKDMNLPPDILPFVRKKYNEKPMLFDEGMRRYLTHIRDLITSPANELHLNNAHLRHIMGASSSDIMGMLTLITDVYQNDRDKYGNRLTIIRNMIVIEAPLIILLTIVFLFRPMILEVLDAYKKASSASLAKSEFLATMSHEIRTPLNGIIGTADLMLGGKLPPKEIEHIKTVIYSAEVLLEIINDILDFSKLETGKISIETSEFNLETLTKDVAHLLSARAREKGIEIIMHYTAGTPAFFIADSAHISQILFNLFSNAIKFTEDGYVLVTVEKTHSYNNDYPDHQWVKVSIEDTGIGLHNGEYNRVFEEFKQVDGSASRKFGGTGLGLAICKRLVDMMGGVIGVESEHGKGSIFWFSIPLIQDEGVHEQYVCPSILCDLNALIVDDIEVNRTLLKEQLSDAGMVCTSCESGAEALNLLREASSGSAPFDVGVFDFIMPEMNGDDLANKIRADKAIKPLPMVILTSAGDTGYVNRFTAAGVCAVMSKPTRREKLIETVAMVHQSFLNKQSALLTPIGGKIVVHDDLYSLSGNIANGVDAKIDLSEFNALLVEDNRINAVMAEEMLCDIGIDCELVVNGSLAVDRCREKSFDVIFMDCQMPVMDGYEATKNIRALEHAGVVKQAVIIALTANAMRGDREKCLEAGMDDYLSKPVRKKDLRKMLEKWLSAGNDDSAADTAHEAGKQEIYNRPVDILKTGGYDTEKMVQDGFDIAAFEEAKIMMKNKFPEMIGYYIEDSQGYLKEIRAGIDKCDVSKVISPAHIIKSSSKQIGAVIVSDVARDIELTARGITEGGDYGFDVILPKLDQLEQSFKQAEIHLRVFLGEAQL